MTLLQTRTFRAVDKQNLEMDFVTTCLFEQQKLCAALQHNVFCTSPTPATFPEAVPVFILGS